MADLNRRWYDKYFLAQQAFELLKNLQDRERELISSDIKEISNSINSYHKDNDTSPLSIGLKRVFGLYQQSNARRWYDKNKSLNQAMTSISTLPEKDFLNVMEGLYTTLK